MGGGEVFLIIFNVLLLVGVGGLVYVFVVKPRQNGGGGRSVATPGFTSPMPRPGEGVSVGLAGADSASSYVSPMVIESGTGTRNNAALDRARAANSSGGL